jgi:proline dehydrogenase
MQVDSKISFEDTSVAFSYKTTRELRKANLIFSLVNHPWISAMATGLVKFAFRLNLPIKGAVRATAFSHFCGGETIEETESVMDKLWKFRVGTILDYSVEGEKSEKGFDATTEEILRTLDEAKKAGCIPFSVFKVTGLGSFDLLEKIQKKDALTDEEKKAFERIHKRVDKICRKANEIDIPVLIDAEETWIQDPIDQLAYEMMARYNQHKAIVFNTYQLYRVDSLSNLRQSVKHAEAGNYHVGAKLVRGAYMEKERDRAQKLGYPSPIQPNKESSDKAFNDALEFSIANIGRMAIMCGSHNDYSNLLLTRLLTERDVDPSDRRIWFAQLYGMSDNISFNLANAGYNVAKYVPYGPVKAVMPYLLRRAAENTSVAGQSSRELTLIRRELRRRKTIRQ